MPEFYIIIMSEKYFYNNNVREIFSHFLEGGGAAPRLLRLCVELSRVAVGGVYRLYSTYKKPLKA